MLTPADLAPFADISASKAEQMIDDAMAMATLVAPCLSDASEVVLTAEQEAAVKAILRRAILRWNELGAGAVTQQTAGSFSQSLDTTRSAPKSLFWPSEIGSLQDICKAADPGTKPDSQVFTINTRARSGARHSPYCNIWFGSATCSCGSYLNRFEGPIPEYGEMP